MFGAIRRFAIHLFEAAEPEVTGVAVGVVTFIVRSTNGTMRGTTAAVLSGLSGGNCPRFASSLSLRANGRVLAALHCQRRNANHLIAIRDAQ
jgi:hypothetical protein